MKKVILSVLILFCSIVMVGDFDMNRFDHVKYGKYTYLTSKEGKEYVDKVEWTKQSDDIYRIVQKRFDDSDDLVQRIDVELRADGMPLKSIKYGPEGNIITEAIYDYKKSKVSMKKVEDGQTKTKKLNIKEGIIQDSYALLFTPNGMKFSEKISFAGYSSIVQKVADMSLEKKSGTKIDTNAGEFDTVEYEQSVDGLLSLVVPNMYYYIDKETRLLVKFTVTDTEYLLIEIQSSH